MLEANLGTVKLPQSSAGGDDTIRQRTETEPQPEEPVVKRSQRKRQSQIAQKVRQRRRTWTTTSRRSMRISLSGTKWQKSTANSRQKSIANCRQKSTANSRQKSIPNNRGESKEHKEQCQLQAEAYEENNVSNREVGPMTSNKDTESRQRMAAQQELKVSEKAREHQVEIETEIEVKKQKTAELKGR